MIVKYLPKTLSTTLFKLLCHNYKISLIPCQENNFWQAFYHSTHREIRNDRGSFRALCLQNSVIKPQFIHFVTDISDEDKHDISKNMLVIESFLSTDEEKSLLNEIEPYMKRLRYEFSHWDNAIHGFRETERLHWNEENSKIINRVRDTAFLPGSPQLRHVHILDLDEKGYIKPHIDSVRFCGNTIAGLSLLTDAVMRLVHDKNKTKIVDVLLKRRSLYIMRDSVRYDYTHEVLPNEESKFMEQPIEKKRRISIICRNEPTSSNQ